MRGRGWPWHGPHSLQREEKDRAELQSSGGSSEQPPVPGHWHSCFRLWSKGQSQLPNSQHGAGPPAEARNGAQHWSIKV